MSNAQKTPFVRSMNDFAAKKALSQIKKTGRSLPGHVVAVNGAIVTINFDVLGVTLPRVTMPIQGAEYQRLPVQINDKGYALPADVYLGGVSGLGGGTADMTQRGNLSTLGWFPLGNKNWTLPGGADGNTYVAYGKDALLLLDSFAANASIKLTNSEIAMNCGGHNIVINASGVIIDGKPFLPHSHSGVQSGGSDTGPVV